MKTLISILALCVCLNAVNVCDNLEIITDTVAEELPGNAKLSSGKSSETTDGVICLPCAGSLEKELEGCDFDSITCLKLSGPMDARDFNFIRWNLQNMEDLDLSDVVVVAYSGDKGTNEGYNASYAADEIPLGAFFYWCDHIENGTIIENDQKHFDEGMPSLRRVTLPSGIKAIRRNAFARAYNLTEINFPEGLEMIDYVSFRYCVSLESVVLPSTLKEIGRWSFTEMAALREVQCNAIVPPSLNDSFGTLTDVEGARGWVNTLGYDASNCYAILYVPEESVEAYRKSDWNNCFKEIRPIGQ